MKKLVVVCLLVLLVTPTVTFAEKVKVRWFVGLGVGSDKDAIEPEKQFVADFNKSQDEIELVLDIVGSAQAYDVLATQLAAGNAPDIVGPVGIKGRDSFKGAWLDLQPLVDTFNYDLSDFDQSLVDFYRVKEEGLLGLPFAVYPSFMYINKDLFDEAGLPYPPQKFGEPYDGKEWNMDTLRELAMKLTVDKNGNDATVADFDPENIVQFGFGMQMSDSRGYGTFFGPGSFVDEQGKAQIPAEWKAAWQWIYNGIWRDHFYPNGSQGQSDYLGQGNWFQTGHVAMSPMHLWYASCCMADFEGHWDTAIMPSYQGKITAKMHADTFEISKGSKNPEAAFKVLAYLTGAGVEPLLQIYGGMPARKSLQNDFFKKFGEQRFPGQQINWEVVQASLQYADNPSHESWMPSFQESTNKYSEFWTRLTTTPNLDLDAEMNQLQADLQKIFEAANTTK